MTVDEATQVNGVPDPNAGVLDANKVQEKDWSIESGMS
jgi:putative hydrolase of HD superfamily